MAPIQSIDAGQGAAPPWIHIRTDLAEQIDVNDAEIVGHKKLAIVIGERDSVWVGELAIYGNGNESLRRTIETVHLSAETVRNDHLTVFADYQIVETMFGAVFRRKPPQQFAGSAEVQQFRIALAIPEAVGPHASIGRIHADSEDRQQVENIRRDKVRDFVFRPLRDDFHDFPAIEAAQVEHVLVRVVR